MQNSPWLLLHLLLCIYTSGLVCYFLIDPLYVLNFMLLYSFPLQLLLSVHSNFQSSFYSFYVIQSNIILQSPHWTANHTRCILICICIIYYRFTFSEPIQETVTVYSSFLIESQRLHNHRFQIKKQLILTVVPTVTYLLWIIEVRSSIVIILVTFFILYRYLLLIITIPSWCIGTVGSSLNSSWAIKSCWLFMRRQPPKASSIPRNATIEPKV